MLMEDGNKWLYKNKEHGMLSATASIGLVLLWDVDGGALKVKPGLPEPPIFEFFQLELVA